MSKKVINTDKAPAAIGPYVQAHQIGDFLYTSGQLPIDMSTGEVPEDIGLQTKACLENVKSILNEAGYQVTDIFKALVFVKDLNQFGQVNAAYEEFFKSNGHSSFPARSCVEVARLPKDVGVEIEVIAHK